MHHYFLHENHAAFDEATGLFMSCIERNASYEMQMAFVFQTVIQRWDLKIGDGAGKASNTTG